jgi:hypothetical protein
MTPNHPQPEGSAPAPVSALLRADGDSIRYEVGNPGFRGRTAVEVHGDGRVEASFQREAEITSYRLLLSPAELADLRVQLDAADPRHLRSERDTAAPDENQVQITFTDAGGRTDVAAWYGEQWTNPRLHALIAAFSALAGRASGGKISD